MQVPGVDVAFIGPNDLAASLGHIGDLKHPNVSKAIAAVEAAAKKANVALATISSHWSDAEILYQRGYQMLTLCSDVSLITQGATELMNKFHGNIK